MPLTADIQRAIERDYLPSDDDFMLWLLACAASCLEESDDVEVSIRLVSIAEMTELNTLYCQKPKPTNVLSFPTDFPEELNIPLLGDIVICAEVVEQEAIEQEKLLAAHWAHMTIHGMLHLLGYDHINDSDANEMETLETNILLELNYPAPY